jgi:hypothetical protein
VLECGWARPQEYPRARKFQFLRGLNSREKALAEVILKSVLSLCKGFNDLDPIVREIKDPDERRRLLMCLGTAMSELNAGIVLRIVSQYPELDPDAPESTHDLR